jgi:dihydrofolate synthase/folylpolyglutamate synthase
MSYARLLTLLYEQNQFSIKYDLDAMRLALLREGLDRDQHTLRILVGGTNGKGTVCSLLHAALHNAGKRVGVYTSPHLVDFRERIRVNGAPIPESDCARLGLKLWETYSGRVGESPAGRALSYFELTTLIAFHWFREQDVEVEVIEVGMGGRLDATNAQDPDISVITSVSLDHQAYLGDTVHKIAWEKSFIARPGRPCLLASNTDGAVEAATAVAAQGGDLRIIPTSGPARSQNDALAQAAFELACHRLGVDAGTWSERTRGCAWPGRQQVLVAKGRTWLIDGAHNVASVRECCGWLAGRSEVAKAGRVHALVGLSPDKDPLTILGPLLAFFRSVTCVRVDTQRTQDPEFVAAELQRATEAPVQSLPDAAAAISSEVWGPGETVAVIGSLYLVGSVLRELGATPESLAIVDV